MIFAARQLHEKCEKPPDCDLFVTVVDPTKSFDTVSRDALWKITKKSGCLNTPLSWRFTVQQNSPLSSTPERPGHSTAIISIMYNVDNLEKIVRIFTKNNIPASAWSASHARPLLEANNGQSLILPSLQFFLDIQPLECYYWRMASEKYLTRQPFPFLLSC